MFYLNPFEEGINNLILDGVEWIDTGTDEIFVMKYYGKMENSKGEIISRITLLVERFLTQENTRVELEMNWENIPGRETLVYPKTTKVYY